LYPTDSQHTSNESWLPLQWPNRQIDFDNAIPSDSHSTQAISTSIAGFSYDHSILDSPTSSSLGSTSASATLPVAVFPPPVYADADSPHTAQTEASESYLAKREVSLIQLLELQMEMHQTSIPTLDMILKSTQSLIAILRIDFSSSPPVHCSQDSTITLLEDSGIHARLPEDVGGPTDWIQKDASDVTTTLISLSCYSTLLVICSNFVASFVSSGDVPSEQSILQVQSILPSLNLGTFKITARSPLFFSTVLHVLSEMLERLQKTLLYRFSLPVNIQSHTVASLTGNAYSVQSTGGCDSNGIFPAAHAALLEIFEMERTLMDIIATKRKTTDG
jgi:hypothetical protein